MIQWMGLTAPTLQHHSLAKGRRRSGENDLLFCGGRNSGIGAV